MIANAAMTCEDHFGFGDNYQSYCNLECGFNVYDATADTSAGDCDALIAAGFSCADTFDVGGTYEGYCDFSCGFCTQPVPPPPPPCPPQEDWLLTPAVELKFCDRPSGSCGTNNHYDEQTGNVGDCAELIAGGSVSCEVDFAALGEYVGYCDLECGFNFNDVHNDVSCDEHIAEATLGGSDACAANFDAGRQFAGYCDFACGFCEAVAAPPPAPPPAPPRTPGSCGAVNQYDEDTDNAGFCDSQIAAGEWSCDGNLAPGGSYSNYCSRSCGHNVLDGSEGTLGHCESLIAADTSLCATQYDAFQSSEGLCDFACGFCAPPPPPPESRTCWVQDNLDVQPPAEWGSCSELINSGLFSCDEHFHGAGAGAGSHVGQCNLACELNLLEHPLAYMNDGMVDTVANALMQNGLGDERVVGVENAAEMRASFAGQTRAADGSITSPGICQVIIEAEAALGVDACATVLAPGVLITDIDIGLCDFACGYCQPTNPVQYVAPSVTVTDCDTMGACCSATYTGARGDRNISSSVYEADAALCEAGTGVAQWSCETMFAPDRPFAGLCDLQCGYCGDLCEDVDCGENGSCNTDTGHCDCSGGYLGHQCQFTFNQCTPGHEDYDDACCWMAGPSSPLAEAEQAMLLASSTNVWDHTLGAGQCAQALAPPPPAPPSGGAMTAGCSVQTLDTALAAGGYTTMQLKCELPEGAANVYVLAGTQTTPMSFPAAYQVPAPFGSDMGAPSPAFIPIMAEVAFDSYLTVGQEQADLSVSPGPGGADAVAAWGVSESVGIESTDGAIFYMDPDSGPASNGAMLFAQLTLADETVAAGGTATAGLQGRSVGGGTDWEGYAVTWVW